MISRETFEILHGVECDCGMTPGPLPARHWEQWTKQHLAMHPPGSVAVHWRYDKTIRWTLEET